MDARTQAQQEVYATFRKMTAEGLVLLANSVTATQIKALCAARVRTVTALATFEECIYDSGDSYELRPIYGHYTEPWAAQLIYADLPARGFWRILSRAGRDPTFHDALAALAVINEVEWFAVDYLWG